MYENTANPTWYPPNFDEEWQQILQSVDDEYPAQFGAQFGDCEPVTDAPAATADYPQTLNTGDEAQQTFVPQELQYEHEHEHHATADYPQTVHTGDEAQQTFAPQELQLEHEHKHEHERDTMPDREAQQHIRPAATQEHEHETLPGCGEQHHIQLAGQHTQPPKGWTGGYKRKRGTADLPDLGTPPPVTVGARRSPQTPSNTNVAAAPPSLTTWGLDNVGHEDLTPSNGQDQSVAGAAPPSHASERTAGSLVCGMRRRDGSVCRKNDIKISSDLWKHRRSHVPKHLRPYPCGKPGCLQRFWFPKDTLRHNCKGHNGQKTTCPWPDCDFDPIDSNIERQRKEVLVHIGATHRDSNRQTDRQIIAACMETVMASSTVDSTAVSSIFSVPSTPGVGTSGSPLTNRTFLSSGQSNASFGNQHNAH